MPVVIFRREIVFYPQMTSIGNQSTMNVLRAVSTVSATSAAFRTCRRVSTRRPATRVVCASATPDDDSSTETFTAPMLQNVRQKVSGFETTMAVSKLPSDEEKSDERKPKAKDLVSILFSAQTEDGEVLQGMEDMEEPLTFEVGGAAAMGNPLFLAFDSAVQGMVVGDQALVNASGGEYDPALLFKVLMEHPEIGRLQEELDQPGKGGLHPGATVALSNGNAAVIREMNEEAGFVLIDCNHPFAGSDLQFAVKLVGIEDNPDDEEEA